MTNTQDDVVELSGTLWPANQLTDFKCPPAGAALWLNSLMKRDISATPQFEAKPWRRVRLAIVLAGL